MTGTTPTCCEEYAQTRGASRRGVLAGAVALGAGGLLAGPGAVFGSTVVSAAAAPVQARVDASGRVMVVLSLRGAVDGMSLVVPHGDPVYASSRPTIGIPRERLLVPDAQFGLHPELAPLLPMWQAGRMAAVHATGLVRPNRSHFAAMEEVEDADPGSRARVGWLNRLVGPSSSPLRAVQVGDTVPPTSLAGPRATLAFRDVDSVQLAGVDPKDPRARRQASVHTLWSGAGGPMARAAATAMRTVHDFAPVRATGRTPANGAAYPSGDLGRALAATARTLRGNVGVQVVTVDHGDWDHHSGLGTLAWGEMQRMTRELAQALAAFFTDLGPLADTVTVVTISEFGRRTEENASAGLDHGHGNVMLLLGAGVRGGHHGRWPGLTRGTDADLSVTTDYRSVLSEVVTHRLGASSAQVFPGFSPSTVGAVTSL